jgi:predicted GNAT superfamily acetyltransferase
MIPEFSEGQYGLTEFQQRLGPESLVLIAFDQMKPVGFKAGYTRGPSGSFYSWMGGVLPAFRRQGIARALARQQEKWAKDQG